MKTKRAVDLHPSSLILHPLRIDGDLVELLFNPRQVDLRVGETLTLRERETGRSVIVQVISFRSASYPSLAQELMHSLLGPESFHAPLLETIGYQMLVNNGKDDRSALSGNGQLGDIKIALAKIRKTVPEVVGPGEQARWEQWDGWIPARDVEVLRTDDAEVFANATRDGGHGMRLGWTMSGHDFHIEGQDLEKVNVVTGVKGSGKSHLAKVILLQLIEQGAPCLVFDINREYIHLPKAEPTQNGRAARRGIVHLEAGGNFRLGVRQFGLPPLLTLLHRYGLPEVPALHFENRVARLWAEAEAMERNGRKPPYVGLEQFIQMAEESEFGGGSSAMVINSAIRSRLEALKNTHIFARTASEAASLGNAYRQIREGGALVIDISGLSNLAREGFVQAIIELVKDLCLGEIDNGTHRFPFIFFEEAHLYVSRSAATDFETMAAFVRRLRRRHALVIGNVTSYYPLIFEVDPLEGVNTAGETRFFFR